jgi:hypothetical protein
MKSPRPKEWTDEEVRLLTRMARQNLTSSEIASALGRHVASVKRMAQVLCLPLTKRLKPGRVTTD